jgi:hypothetical protein
MKYPRTYHLPYSPGATKEKYKDKIINFKDFYMTLMFDGLINKWGD